MSMVIRVFSFFEQWTAEVLRQPALMFTLVFAPFLLLLAFGDGVKIGGPRPRTIIVQEPGSQVPIDRLLEGLQHQVELKGTTDNLPEAQRALEDGEVDAVAVVPNDPNSYLARGERIPIRVLIGEIDPVRRSYARSNLLDQVALMNQRAVAEAVASAQGGIASTHAVTQQARPHVQALGATTDVDDARQSVDLLKTAIAPLDAAGAGLESAAVAGLVIPGLASQSPDGGGVERLQQSIANLTAAVDRADQQVAAAQGETLPAPIPTGEIDAALGEIDRVSGEMGIVNPEVLSAPFFLQLEDVTPFPPNFTAFYSPGVLALLVQHLAITLAALTLARMRLLRVTEVLRVAPIRTFEVVLGNYASYAVLCALAAAGLLALLVLVLDVPVIGPYALVAVAIGLIILCSLGLGLLASQISSSVQQATQIAMLLLLASIFFSGFAFGLDRIDWPVRAISYLLPATYGIRTLQDIMLRGWDPRLLDFAVLTSAAAALFVLNVYLLRREFRATR